MAPGTGFGAGEGFIRISLTAGDEALSNALDRLAGWRCFSPPQGEAKRNPPSGITRLTSPSPTARFCPQDAPALLAHAPSAPAQGKTLSIATRMTPASSRSASRASCAPLERTGWWRPSLRAVAPLPPRQSRAERSGTARRRVAGYAKRPLAGPPGASMTVRSRTVSSTAVVV